MMLSFLFKKLKKIFHTFDEISCQNYLEKIMFFQNKDSVFYTREDVTLSALTEVWVWFEAKEWRENLLLNTACLCSKQLFTK